jgi:hypothetical protein
MTLHHAAAIVLTWTLLIPLPDTLPKDCHNCATLDLLVGTIKHGFLTRKACRSAAAKWKADFIRDAQEKNLDIIWPSKSDPMRCLKDGPVK